LRKFFENKEKIKMNAKIKVVTAAAIFCVGTCAFAAPRHHHYHNEGLELANGIVDLVCKVLKPAPVVVAPATTTVVTQPAPVVITRPAPVIYYTHPAPPPRHHRGRPGRGGHRR
jgi:hypothetical protein